MSIGFLEECGNKKNDLVSNDLIFEEVPPIMFGISTTKSQPPDTIDLNAEHASESHAINNETCDASKSESEPIHKEVLPGVNIDAPIKELIKRRGFCSTRLQDAIKEYWSEYTGKSGNLTDVRILESLSQSTTAPCDHPFYLVMSQKVVEEGLLRNEKMVQTHFFFYADVLTDFEYDMLCDISEVVHSRSPDPKHAYKSVLFHELLKTEFFAKYRQWSDSNLKPAQHHLNLQIFSFQLCGTAYMKRLEQCRDEKTNHGKTFAEPSVGLGDDKKESLDDDHHLKDPNLSVTLMYVVLPDEKHVVDAKATALRKSLDTIVGISNSITKVLDNLRRAPADASEHPFSEQERHRIVKRHKPSTMSDSVDAGTATATLTVTE